VAKNIDKSITYMVNAGLECGYTHDHQRRVIRGAEFSDGGPEDGAARHIGGPPPLS
jgi:hypothetical protein